MQTAAAALSDSEAPPAPTIVRTPEERFARAVYDDVELKRARRGIALGLATSLQAGAVARRSAEVHAELRRVLGPEMPART